MARVSGRESSDQSAVFNEALKETVRSLSEFQGATKGAASASAESSAAARGMLKEIGSLVGGAVGMGVAQESFGSYVNAANRSMLNAATGIVPGLGLALGIDQAENAAQRAEARMLGITGDVARYGGDTRQISKQLWPLITEQEKRFEEERLRVARMSDAFFAKEIETTPYGIGMEAVAIAVQELLEWLRGNNQGAVPR